MRHLSNIGLKNFRVFKDLTEFNFAPITVLTGTNNSGKSSLLKALLLLKYNWKRYENLDFSGSQHLLGNYTSTVHANKAKNNITFQLPFSLPAIGSNLYLELVYELDKSNELKNGILKEYNIVSRNTGKKVFSISNNPYSPEVRLDFDFFITRIKDYQNTKESYRSKWNKKVELQFELEQKKKRTKPEEELQKLLNEEVTKKHNLDDNPNNQNRIFLDSGNRNNHWDDVFLAQDGFRSETKYMTGESILFYPFLYIEDIKRKYNLDDTKINNIIVSWEEMQDEIKTHENSEEFNLQEYLESRSNDLKSFHVVLFIGEEVAILNTIKEKYKLKSTEELYDKFIVDEIEFIQQRINKPTHNDIQGYDNPYLKDVLNDSISAVLRTGLHGKFEPNFKMEGNAVFDYFDLRNNSISTFASLDRKDLNINRDNYNILVTYFDEGFKNAEKEISRFFEKFSTLQTIKSLTHREFSLQNTTQSFEELLHDYHGFSLNIKKYRLEFVNKWLKKFGINETIKIEISDEGKWSKILLGERNLADYGFGLSQLIPLLLKIYMMSINGRNYYHPSEGYNCGTLYIEEPETNLHPRFQSLLADVFYEAAQEYHIQFIIETHSEYLIRKLQYLTAKKKLKPEDTIIYYFNDPDKIPKGEKQVREIRIREDGSLTDDFGPGFFDEADNIALELYRLQRNKAINN